ncbi:hypothetical protein FA13DRAFT_1765321 [Coprinellus micaceus]|uniref:F-box domain-containing protein n=1 Tax=Coprinellus micaceus TaxID=71717 RepID=A0A4Y7T0F9_COPMI|nr:hypothetical protein FA13DRAFT_1765321 [Coprinellus micaceus]
MELTLEAISIIVKHTGSRSEVALLCRVSKSFRRVAERALYKTIHLSNSEAVLAWSSTLIDSPRLACLESDVSNEDSNESYDVEMPEEIWEGIGAALRKTTNLKSLIMHSQNSPIPAHAAILRDTSFTLHIFHCDFDWDDDLIHFLNAQTVLRDLYILDFKKQASTPSRTTDTIDMPSPSNTILDASSMPHLTTLECTFSEAVDALAPHRPRKEDEMNRLFRSISRSSRSIRSLDIADSSYDEAFSMDLLRTVISTKGTRSDLRYLGTLVLPVDGQERLKFYGLLMRLPVLQTIELEISEWEPPPSTAEAFRALAKELRLYCPTVTSVVFVLDFERTLVTFMNGAFIVDVGIDAGADLLWRDI